TFPFMILTTRWFGEKIRSAFRKVQETLADVSDHLQNTLSGIRLIKSFGAEKYEERRFEEHAQSNMEANIRAIRLRSLYEPIIDFLNYLGLAIVIVFGAWLVMKSQITIGAI